MILRINSNNRKKDTLETLTFLTKSDCANGSRLNSPEVELLDESYDYLDGS